MGQWSGDTARLSREQSLKNSNTSLFMLNGCVENMPTYFLGDPENKDHTYNDQRRSV